MFQLVSELECMAVMVKAQVSDSVFEHFQDY